MQHSVTKDQILATLKLLRRAPDAQDIVTEGLVSNIIINNGSVIFSITVPSQEAQAFEPMRAQAERQVQALDGVEKVAVVLTAEKATTAGQSAAPQARPEAPPQAKPKPAKGNPKTSAMLEIEGVKHIIAVSSAKGGVGKSTTAVNLAMAFKANGLKVGILDADVYGPSIPRLLNIKDRPETVPGTRMMLPIDAYGLQVMSIGLLVDDDTPMVWRGPMAVSALTQMVRDVAWDHDGDLDLLVVDMPPGTGDIQLTMAQQVPLSGSVIVSTPQDLALLDARKGITMFKKVNIPILGIIENMSYFRCPDCGGRHDIFGHGGARETATGIGVPFLGEIPLHMDIRERADAGTPIVEADPQGEHATLYRSIATSVFEGLEGVQKAAPSIVFE